MDSMLGFKKFVLYEMAKILSGGRNFERHIDQYVRPHVVNVNSDKADPTKNDSPLTTAVDLYTTTKGSKIPKGSKVIPIEHSEKKGMPVIADLQKVNQEGKRTGTAVKHISCKVIKPDGNSAVQFIPVTSILTPTESEGKHNYEHAVKTLWNFVSSNKHLVTGNDGKLNLDRLKQEVENSKADETHPLHHNKSTENEFAGGVKDSEKAKLTRYLNLQAAAYTVNSLANHPEIEKHFKNGSKMSVEGGDTAPLSQIYNDQRIKTNKKYEIAKAKFDKKERERLKGSNKFPKSYTSRSTRKGDAVVLGTGKDKIYISLKQQEAQGASGEAAETMGNFHYSLGEMRRKFIENHGVSPEVYDRILENTHKDLDEMCEHMISGNHKDANNILQNILDNPFWIRKGVNQLHVHVAQEALSGAGKFQRSTSKEQKETGSRYTKDQGPATHMSTVPLNKGELSKNPEDVADTTRLTHGNIAELIKKDVIKRPTITKGKNNKDSSVMRIIYKK